MRPLLALLLVSSAALAQPSQPQSLRSGQRTIPDTIQPGIGTKAPFINVKADPYRAKGDGSDDTSAVQAVLTAAATTGASVWFPPSSGAYVTTIPGLGTVQPGSLLIGAGTPDSRLMVHRIIEPARPAPQAPTTYPQGNDLQLQTSGPADIHLANNAADVTATTNAVIGANASVVVGSTTGLCTPAGGCSILIEPSSVANYELIGSANWSIVDGTHISFTAAKNHTQPYTVRQHGGIFVESGQLTRLSLSTPNAFVSVRNSANTADMVKIQESSGGVIFKLGNPTNPTQFFLGMDQTDYPRMFGGGTSGGLIYYGSQGGTGTNGTFRVRNNSTDENDKFVVDTSTSRTTAFNLAVNTGVIGDAGGLKHKRGTAGCTTAASAGAVCTQTVSWGTAFADNSYTVACTGNGAASGVPVIGAITSRVAASVTIQTVAITAVAAQFTNVECVALHD